MSYNILNGFDWGQDTVRRAQLTTWVRDQAPDVLALQELCGFDQEQLSELARTWGHDHSIILKEEGYPVGLTSNKPIQLREKVLDSLWHGMLHCSTYGIEFFVVHLSPADWQFRRREAAIIQQKILKQLALDQDLVVLGDFNAHSPFDGDFDLKYPYQLVRARRGDQKNHEYKNLRGGLFDYSVMASFLALPLMDACHRLVALDQRTTCPTPLNVPRWLSAEEMTKTRSRIDFVLLSASLDHRCQKAAIFNGKDTHYLSDHFPVMIWLDQ